MLNKEFKLPDVKRWVNQLVSEEITMSRFTEILNEHNHIFSLVDFNRIEPGETINSGVCINSPSDIYMTNNNIGRELLWVAVKGYGNDWCIYIHWADSGLSYVLKSGDKLSPDMAKKLFKCSDDVYKLYRR